MKIPASELQSLVEQVLAHHGVAFTRAPLLAATIVAAERDGSRSHGLQRLAGYVSSLSSGWVDGAAEPVVHEAGPGLLKVDAGNGFAQVALAQAAPQLRAMAAAHGSATLTTANGHHFAGLWPDIEPLAADGYIALTMVNTRAHMAVWQGTRKVLGTNPMAFACPRRSALPVVWDQASSVMSQGDVLLASAAKRPLPAGVGVDASGKATTDPDAVLKGGALLPYGGIKGGSLAFMIEVLATLGGARFGFEDESARSPGAVTSNAGQFLLLIDPRRFGDGFLDRIEALIEQLRDAGTGRLPGDLRYERRRVAERDGVEVSPDMHEYLTRKGRHVSAA
ncbi:MAG TPA: Ldh family oxidoreductase [Reyranella sp.]|nr:Ldh family oxidoreductase [Reyranella sp.]